jgi:DNA-binding response OmpR family regulator
MSATGLILIVDDDPAGRETLEALLSARDYTLVFASTGAEAVSKAAEVQPDLILLDVMMPEMDGFEVCRRLRADAHLAEVPVVMVTALDDRDSRLHGLQSGADDFISKPFDRAELRARVQTILRLNRYRRLLAERAMFEWVVDQAQDGYVLLGESGEVRYANARAQLFLNLSDLHPVSGESQNFLGLASAAYRLEPQEAWGAWPEELTAAPRYLVRPDSERATALWLRVEVLRLPDGLPGGRLVRLRDVTAEVALRRNMWSFHSAIYHKFRTPMAGLLASLEFLATETASLSVEDIRRFSEISLSGGRRLRDELMEIMEYMDASHLAKAGDGFALAWVRTLIERIQEGLKIAPVTLALPDELQSVRVALSTTAMELVLQELLENTRKFHPRETPTVDVTVMTTETGLVLMRVRDDGVHLLPEQLARIWTPYYQAEKHYSGQVAGMGLGLPMVAQLLWEVGGSARLFNRADRAGVVVELALPVSQAKQG